MTNHDVDLKTGSVIRTFVQEGLITKEPEYCDFELRNTVVN
jgi:hypothetical protein